MATRTTLYETKGDRAREARVANQIAAHWRVVMKRRPEKNVIDYDATNANGQMALVEIKCRHHIHGDFDEIYFEEKKWIASREIGVTTVRPYFIVIRWDCKCVGIYRADQADNLMRKMVARTLPREGEPPKMCVLIPLADFDMALPCKEHRDGTTDY